MTDPGAYIVSSSSPFMRQRRLSEEEKYPLWTPLKRKESYDHVFRPSEDLLPRKCPPIEPVFAA